MGSEMCIRDSYVAAFGAVGIKAPVGSSIRILCEEPYSNPKRYTGYFEEIVGGTGTVCITVWINRLCYHRVKKGVSAFRKDSGKSNLNVSDTFPKGGYDVKREREK